MKNEQMTTIVLPGGEWLSAVKEKFIAAGISWIQTSDRSYQVRFPELDISGVITRTKDVPGLVDDPNSIAVAGFTGNDILIEMKKRILEPEPTDPVIPLDDKQSSVYLGFTSNAYEKFGPHPTMEQIMEGVHCLSIPSACSTVF